MVKEVHDAYIPTYSIKDPFFIPITTPYMLENARKSTYLAVDATYNVTREEYPCVIAGVIDKNAKYHPIAYALIEDDESADSYKTFFKFLVDQLPGWSPKYVMADGSPSISSAIKDIFPNSIRLMCHFHVSQRIDDKGQKLYGPGWQQMRKNYNELQLAPNPSVFNAAKELFLR